MMVSIDVHPAEARQFSLLLKRAGVPASAFQLRKYRMPEGRGLKVRVAARGAATVYECRDPHEWLGQFASDLDIGLFGSRGPAPLPPHLRAALDDVAQALAGKGLAAALECLNRRVPHRFTAVYRLQDRSLHNVATVDKHRHLEPLDLQVVPLQDSFCQFVLRDGVFLTEASGGDERLQQHPYAGVVGSYIGVPVADAARGLRGTLCHFDLATHAIEDDEFLLLERAAGLVAAHLR